MRRRATKKAALYSLLLALQASRGDRAIAPWPLDWEGTTLGERVGLLG